MNEYVPVTEADLQAYVDGQLSPARRKEIEGYIATHPEAAELIEDYRFLNESIRELYDPVMEEKLPEQLIDIRAKRKYGQRRSFQAAASIAWLALGAIIGWSTHPTGLMLTQSDRGYETHLIQPASFAHTIYATEKRHPVEVSAREQEHLVGWLSNRLHTDIKAPDLSASDYRLVGGRLLPSTNRMAAQFMYQKQDGARITLYIRRGVWGKNETTFHYSNSRGVSVLYWINGEMGYALVGKLNKQESLKLSQEIYRQIG